jgi:hypothetical protein
MVRGQTSRKATNNSRQNLKNYYGVSKPSSSRNHPPISTSRKSITIVDLTNVGPQQGSQVIFDGIPPTRAMGEDIFGEGFDVANVRPATQKTEPLGKFHSLSLGVFEILRDEEELGVPGSLGTFEILESQ